MPVVCAKCGVPHRSDACPRWAIRGLEPDARVCIRVGGRRWLGAEGHVFACFVDCIESEQIYTLDLTTGEYEEVPLGLISDAASGWAKRPTVSQKQDALDELRNMGLRCRLVSRIPR